MRKEVSDCAMIVSHSFWPITPGRVSRLSEVKESRFNRVLRMAMFCNDAHPGPIDLKFDMSEVQPRDFQIQSALIGTA